MTEALEDKLTDLRERVDVLLAKQKAYRRERLKTKQVKQQSKTKTLQNPEPLNLQQYQIKDREQNLSKQRRTEMKYLGIAVIIGIVFGAFVMGGGGDKAVDLLSLIFVLGVASGHALGVKDGESAITRFGDGCARGGWLGLLVGLTLIAGGPSASAMDFSALMPAFSIAVLAPLYGYFFKIITMQLD